MQLLVGCPVSHRHWILPQWFQHVSQACATANLAVRYVFVGDPSDPSFEVIGQLAPNAITVEVIDTRSDDRRIWRPSRYHKMVELRNLLLSAVRTEEPELFLSLDSDILLHPQALALLKEDLDRFDAVGARCYMTKSGPSAPSYANLGREGALRRPDAFGVFACQVIMAAKLMTPPAYRVDYRFHIQGEDIGWSLACAEAGLRLGWDGRVASKHIVVPSMLNTVDERVGF